METERKLAQSKRTNAGHDFASESVTSPQSNNVRFWEQRKESTGRDNDDAANPTMIKKKKKSKVGRNLQLLQDGQHSGRNSH